MKRQDLVSGLVLAVLGILVARQAATLTYRDEFGPGPGLLPFWLGWIMFALALCQVAVTLWRNPETSPASSSGKSRVLLAALSFAAMVGAIDVIGFFAGFGALTFFLVYAVERRSLTRSIAVAVAMTLAFVLLFRVLLPVPLPLNDWGF
jgi:hypothetical protein